MIISNTKKILKKITTKKNSKKIIYQISLASIFSALAIIIGIFIHFGEFYFCAIIIFLMPLFLNFLFLIISTSLSIFIIDLATGFILNTWISLIAYLTSVIILWIFKKKLLTYLLGLIIASVMLIIIYFFLESIIFHALAIHDAIATSIEISISLGIIFLIINPVYKIKPFLISQNQNNLI